MAILSSLDEIRAALAACKTIAVIGASLKPDRPAHYVPDYMKKQGYKVYPVNPAHEGASLFGETVRAKVSELADVDMVNIFRRSQDVPQHLDDILDMQPLPKLVWLQLGIKNDEVAEALSRAGIDVVQDRCLMIDHRTLSR
jgi:uncharacterized protein